MVVWAKKSLDLGSLAVFACLCVCVRTRTFDYIVVCMCNKKLVISSRRERRMGRLIYVCSSRETIFLQLQTSSQIGRYLFRVFQGVQCCQWWCETKFARRQTLSEWVCLCVCLCLFTFLCLVLYVLTKSLWFLVVKNEVNVDHFIYARPSPGLCPCKCFSFPDWPSFI